MMITYHRMIMILVLRLALTVGSTQWLLSEPLLREAGLLLVRDSESPARRAPALPVSRRSESEPQAAAARATGTAAAAAADSESVSLTL